MGYTLKWANAGLYGLFGGVALLAFEPIGFYPLAWVCLIPLLLVKENGPWLERLLSGYIFGLAFYGIGLSWIPESIVSFSDFALSTSWASFALILVFLALFPATFQFLLGYVPGNRFRLLVVAPSLWVVLEAVRSISWGGLPWLELAATQVDGPLTGLIPIIGGVGMNFLLVSMNGLFLLLVQGAWRSRVQRPTLDCILPLTVLLLTILGGFFLQHLSWVEPQRSSIRVGMVQAGRWDAHEVSPDERRELVNIYQGLAKQITSGSDVVVLPESAVWYDWEKWSRGLQKQTRKDTAYIVGAMEKTLGGNRYNSVFLFKDSKTLRYRKQRLVPIGESRPPWIVAPFVGPVGETGNHVLPGRIHNPLQWHNTKFGVLICWEIRFPGLVTDYLHAGADILVNPANESWLDSNIAKQRSLAVARLRAAETGRMLVRVANRGLSALIGPGGRILSRLPGREAFAKVVQARAYTGNTPYISLRLEIILKAVSFMLVLTGVIYSCYTYRNIFFLGHPVCKNQPQ